MSEPSEEQTSIVSQLVDMGFSPKDLAHSMINPRMTESDIEALGAKAAEENRDALACLQCYIEQVRQENFGGLGIYGTFARDDLPHLERAAKIIRIALGDTLPPQGDAE